MKFHYYKIFNFCSTKIRLPIFVAVPILITDICIFVIFMFAFFENSKEYFGRCLFAVNICNFLTCPSGTYCSSSTAMCLCNSGSMVIGTYPGFSFIQQCEVINNLSLVITLPIFGGLLLIAVIILIVFVRKRDKNRYDLNSEYFRNGNFRSNAYAIGDEHVPGQQRSDRPSIEGAQLVNFNNQSQPNAQNSMSRL